MLSVITQYYGKKPKMLLYSQKVPDFHRSRWKEGDWTDDTDQMILILHSILFNKGQVNFLNVILHHIKVVIVTIWYFYVAHTPCFISRYFR